MWRLDYGSNFSIRYVLHWEVLFDWMLLLNMQKTKLNFDFAQNENIWKEKKSCLIHNFISKEFHWTKMKKKRLIFFKLHLRKLSNYF